MASPDAGPGTAGNAPRTSTSPQGIVGDQAQRRVVGRCARRSIAPRVRRRLHLSPLQIKPQQTPQDREKLWGLTYLLTQRLCLGVGVLHLGRSMPFGHLQCRAEGNVQRSSSAGYARASLAGT